MAITRSRSEGLARTRLLSGYAMPPTPNRGGSYLTAPDTEKVGHSTPISPNLAIGGPTWPRGWLQTTFEAWGKLGARFSAPGDHSEAISDNLWVLGPGPLFEYLTHFEILEIQFFSNSPWDCAHWNRTAILDLGVASV